MQVCSISSRRIDAHIHAQFFSENAKDGRPYGLSMGQWLSVAMVAVGVIALALVSRRSVAKMGGWWRRPNPAVPR